MTGHLSINSNPHILRLVVFRHLLESVFSHASCCEGHLVRERATTDLPFVYRRLALIIDKLSVSTGKQAKDAKSRETNSATSHGPPPRLSNREQGG